MNHLLEEYQTICSYKITNNIQELNISIDIDRLQTELLDFISNHKYGIKSVSLKLSNKSIDPADFVDTSEDVWHQGISIRQYENVSMVPKNTKHELDYVHWHPSLKNSYTKEVSDLLEKYSGLKIGRVRLVWLLPKMGYPMHVDLEPMRYHIPLITNKLSYFISNNSIYHMEYGKTYQLITTTEHTTHNFSTVPRLHLIFSTYANETIHNTIQKIINEDFSINNYYSQFENSGLTQRSLSKLIQIDPDYTQKYQKIIDNLRSD